MEVYVFSTIHWNHVWIGLFAHTMIYLQLWYGEEEEDEEGLAWRFNCAVCEPGAFTPDQDDPAILGRKKKNSFTGLLWRDIPVCLGGSNKAADH